jgi:hypothetical protein
MAGENFKKLVDFVLPPIPTTEDMGKQETEYVKRVEKVSKKYQKTLLFLSLVSY